MNKICSYLLIFTFAFYFSGCVGTIKDANSVGTFAQNNKKTDLTKYPGIAEVKAIADTKVDVYFPAFNGELDNIAYVIRYSGQRIPIYIAANTLTPVLRYNEEGERVSSLKATIGALAGNTDYNFSVDVRDIKVGNESSNNIYRQVKTFSNPTAQFGGVVEVKNVPGVEGMTSIEVSWIEAEVRGSSISKNDVDPISYVITVLDGSTNVILKSPADMNNKAINDGSRLTFNVNAGNRSQVINGLRANTKYYVQVRAINHGYLLNASNVNYKLEENTNYVEIITYDPNMGVSVNYPNSLQTSYPVGTQGLTTINVMWTPAHGVFDHYRLYYSLSSTAPTINSTCTTDCQRIEASKNSYQLVGVTPYQTYYLVMAACQDINCSGYRTYTRVTHVTSPPVITSYSGIQLIEPAKNLGTLDKLFLNLSLPDFSQGYISGVDIFGCQSFGSSDCNPHLEAVPLNDSASTSVLIPNVNYDYSVDAQLAISGIDPSSTVSYCFVAKPYVYDFYNNKSYIDAPLSLVNCKVPEIKAPSFAGLESQSTCEVLTWQTPTSGVFDAFELYYRHKTTPYEAALPLTDPSYSRLIINADATSFSTLQLPLIDDNYDFGIRTLYRSSEGINSWLRSDNVSVERIVKCPMN